MNGGRRKFGLVFVASLAFLAFFCLAAAPLAQKLPPSKKIVYITRKGNKYHRDSCRYLSKSKIAITLGEAKRYYKPCAICKPDSTK